MLKKQNNQKRCYVTTHILRERKKNICNRQLGNKLKWWFWFRFFLIQNSYFCKKDFSKNEFFVYKISINHHIHHHRIEQRNKIIIRCWFHENKSMEREKNRFIWLNKTTEFFKQTIDTKWKNLDSKIYFLFRFKHHRDGDVKHGANQWKQKKIKSLHPWFI